MENKALLLDLVEWIAEGPRPYSDVMRTWRTSCPRLPIWEDALDLRLVCREFRGDQGLLVEVTSKGLAFLHEEGRGRVPASP